MTTVAASGRSSAAPAGLRPLSRPHSAAAGVLLVLAAAALGPLVPFLGRGAPIVLTVALPATAALILFLRAPRTAAPSGWRWFAAGLALVGVGSVLAAALHAGPGAAILGGVPGRLLSVVAFHRLQPGPRARNSRAHAVASGTLFLLASLLAVHVAFGLTPFRSVPSASLHLAVDAMPLVIAITTAAAALFAAGSAPSRRGIAVLMLVAQAFFAGSAICNLVARLPEPGWAQTAVWPVVLAGLATVVLACLRDLPSMAARPVDTPFSDAAMDLLPYGMTLVAGALMVGQCITAGRIDIDDGVMAELMMAALVAHQAVMWTTQRRLTAEVSRSESYFRTLVKSSVDPVVILDDRLHVTFASPALSELIGIDPSGAVGRSLGEVVHPDDAPVLFGALSGRGRSGETAVRTARLRHADGGWRLIQASVRDLRDDPDVGALVLFCRDVSPRTPVVGADPELLELSLTDPVTGLPNRTALVRRLGAVQRGETGGRPAALALVGVSGICEADALAPGSQPAVLRALTSRLTRALRGEDWLARGKNGEFVVLVDGSIADAEVVASRLVAGVGSLMTAAGPVTLTASAGITPLPPDVDPGEALRRCAVALASAELAGPSVVHRYDDALRMQQDRSDALRADLDGAVARGELRLVFQPVVDLVLHRTVSVEALLRWRHPVFGDVPPVEFVPLAEQSPLIGELGRWVLREACSAVAALPGTDLSVAVNVSARQVRSGELVADVLAALGASGLPASRLTVEITESVLMDDTHVIEDLTVLRQLGVRIAVDDFGTGWSSLAYLVGLPIDVLKMDQHFVADVELDPQRQALCRAVLQLGASLGLPVIVEGVTTEGQLTLLRDMGHRYLQGYVFSRPLEADQLAAGAWRTGIALPPSVPASGAPAPGVPAPRAEVAGNPPVGAP